MKQVPAHIEAELKRYDPLLRLRWSREYGRFAVDRKIPENVRRMIPPPVKYYRDGYGRFKTRNAPEHSERGIPYREGYAPVFYSDVCDRRLLIGVFTSDTGLDARQFIRDWENGIERQERRQKEQAKTDFEEISKDAYDHLKWADGRTVAVTRSQ